MDFLIYGQIYFFCPDHHDTTKIAFYTNIDIFVKKGFNDSEGHGKDITEARLRPLAATS